MPKSKNILIVEDNVAQATVISQILDRNGYNIVGVVDQGEKAITRTLELLPDLIIMDIFLNGDMSGIEAMQKIREKSDASVIYISGNSDSYYKARAVETGCVDFFNKPVRHSDLLRATRRAFKEGTSLSMQTSQKKQNWPFSLF